jgi:hypothetical protein
LGGRDSLEGEVIKRKEKFKGSDNVKGEIV